MDTRRGSDIEEDDAAAVAAAAAARKLRTRARWRKVRAATLVFLLFRRRVHQSAAAARHGGPQRQPHKRMPTSVFFAKPSVQAAAAAAAQRLSAQPTAAASPQVARWFAQKLHLFDRLTRKPIQNRDDVDVKLLAEFIRQTKFFHGLTSASVDALAQVIRFRTYHEGEILHLQGNKVQDTSGRYLVVSGSLLVYKNAQYAQRAREGDDYVEWYLSNSPGATRDTIRYGDCIDTCSTGDITGDDATLEFLFRENSVISQVKTVVAYVTQADYRRVIRFNVENEPQVLEAVRDILMPAKGAKQTHHQARAKDPSQSGVSTRADLSPQQIRVLMRFLTRFRCFRMLPFQFCMDIVAKLQLSTVKSDEVVCLSSDDHPSMLMVLDGRLCVHVHESHESQNLTSCAADRVERRSRAMGSARTAEATEYLPGCEAGITVESSIGSKSLHVCSLAAGDAFGELVICGADTQIQGATIYHPFTSSGQTSATIVRLFRQDYEAALQRYIDTVDFNLTTVCSILSRSLPRDRTDEQVLYMKVFLLLRSSAKLFFGQIPSRILDELLLHAGVETQDIVDDVDSFIQKEGSIVDTMKVILNGYVGVFKCYGSVPHPHTSATGVQDKQIEPKKAVLRRYESRLIRANTRVIDTAGAKQSGRRSSIQKNALNLPNLVVSEPASGLKSEAGVIDPVSILPSGAAFGQLQILTGRSKSPYSYSAFASGPGVVDDTRSPTSDTKQSLHLLSIPAQYVRLCLSNLDGQLVYNPIRALKRLQHASMSLPRGEAIAPALIQRLQIPLLLARNKEFIGIPRMVAVSMIERMEIVGVEPRRVLYEVGEPTRRALFAVLNGSVRVFSYASKPKAGRDRRGSFLPGSDDKRPKLPRRISQEAPELKQDDASGYGELSFSFSKPAGDSIFLSDYSQTMELSAGDSFGRNEHLSFAKTRGRRPSNGPSAASRQPRPHGVYTENVVTMTDCLIGVMSRSEHQCELSSSERMLLIRVIDDRDEAKLLSLDLSENGPQACFESAFDSLGTAFHVLETMGLSHLVPTSGRVQLANRLKHVRFSPGETVFKQGEAGEAIYFVLYGSVNLYMRRHDDSNGEPRTRVIGFDVGNLVIDVIEGEVFGEEAFESSHGCNRLCTAVAGVDDGQDTVLVYLMRSDIEQVMDGNSEMTLSNHGQSKKETAQLLLGLGQRIATAKERWKMAIFQVIQLRAQRSLWPTVLTKARNHRIDLLLDLIKGLSAFEDTPIRVVKEFCCNSVLQTFGQDTQLFCKSDTVVDVSFLVVQGAVTLYQTYFGGAAASGSTSTTPAGHGSQGDSSVRVTIQTMEPGEIFGEFEMMEEHPRRHINAIVALPGTKVLVIQQEDYFAFWPKREHQEKKLSVLKSQLRNLCRLDADQLCSLYYSMKERFFRRNEVIAGNKEHAGYLHVIQEGMCVVHDAVVLKQKKSATMNSSPSKVSLDTRVSTLGPGAILFAERQDTPLPVESRRASSRSLISAEAAPVEPASSTQYVLVDSPTVTTFSVQLFPRRILSLQRQPDLLVVFLLGKSGLQVIRNTTERQLKWRADNVAHTGRLVASAFSQNADRAGEFAKKSVDNEMDQHPRLAKPVAHQDISSALVRCKSGTGKGPHRLAESPSKCTAPTPRHAFDVSAVTTSPRNTFGSFSPTSSSSNQIGASQRGTAGVASPLLPSLAAFSRERVGLAPSSPRLISSDTTTDSKFDAEEQLRKEQQVLLALRRPAPRQDVVTVQQHQQMRRRHGRPPPRRVENSSEFLDEHAVVPVGVLGAEHERKKAGLCRRLLHIKGVQQK